MHKHGFRRILDDILVTKGDDPETPDSHNRAANQLKAASAAGLEPQVRGASRYSANGGYVQDTAEEPDEVVEGTAGDGPEPAANDVMTLQQLKQALQGRLTRADLNRLRRRFALANHPDRASAASRDQSSARLSVANSLIDEAYKNARG